METWEGMNYLTSNWTLWAGLMNRSTAEFNVGPFPSNLVAIPGTLNDTWLSLLPPDALVIENASQELVGDRRTVESTVFGVASGVILALATLWLIWKIKENTLFRSYTESHKSAAFSTALPLSQRVDDQESGMTGYTRFNGEDDSGGNGFMGDATFRHQLSRYYGISYIQGTNTEHEAYEDFERENPSTNDIEHVIKLVRQLHRHDLRLYGWRSAPETTEEDRKAERVKSDAILAEVRIITGKWNIEASEAMRDIQTKLESLKDKRYTGT